MILIIMNNFNPFRQIDYDSFITSIKRNRTAFFDTIFGYSSNIIFYGSYTRSLVSDSISSPMIIKFQRVLDKNTGITHTLIPSQIVPYSTIPLHSQVMIIQAPESNLIDLSVLFNLDPKTLLHIRSVFHAFWESLCDWFSISLTSLPRKAFQLTGRQFMQMRGLVYLSSPT